MGDGTVDHPPDPELAAEMGPLDEQSLNKDAMVVSDLTGRSKTPIPAPRPPSGLKKVTVTHETLMGTSPFTSTPIERSRKQTRMAAPTPSALDEVDEITGTPRSARIAKLFPGGSGAASKPLKVLNERLIDATRATLIPKTKTSKSVKVDVDSAADILLLEGLIQEQASLNEARRVVFEPGRQTIASPFTAPSSQFEFCVSSLSDKLDLVVEQLTKLGSFQNGPAPGKQAQAVKSYALAASKHAPEPATQTYGTRPARRAQPKPVVGPRPDHSITLNQRDPANIAGSDKSIPELIRYLNAQLKVCKVKLTPSDPTDIEFRNIHRHPSGDLVIYLDTAKQAQAPRSQAAAWLPKISANLSIKQEIHSIIVHGVPTTFNPTRQEDVDLLKTCNGTLLEGALSFRWLKKDTPEDPSKRHSSLLIGFGSLAQASLAARTKVWQGRGRHRTKLSGPPPTRCYNCRTTGHTAAACLQPPMCPTCAGPHQAHNCPSKGNSPLKCTACARRMLKLDPHVNLTCLFKDDHPGFLHHPFTATCSTRIGDQIPNHHQEAPSGLIIIDQPDSSSQC